MKQKKTHSSLSVIGGFFICFLVFLAPAYAVEYSDTSRFMQGFGKVVSAPFQLPAHLLQKSFTQAPPIGILNGAVGGTAKTVSYLMSGLWDIAGAAAPYAKYALFF